MALAKRDTAIEVQKAKDETVQLQKRLMDDALNVRGLAFLAAVVTAKKGEPTDRLLLGISSQDTARPSFLGRLRARFFPSS
jgi:hypothetical protein